MAAFCLILFLLGLALDVRRPRRGGAVTARGFIDQVFSRRQAGVDSNMRFLSPEQLALLRRLIDEDRQGELRPGVHGSFVWILGADQYIVTQDAAGRRRSILWMKAQRIEAPTLF